MFPHRQRPELPTWECGGCCMEVDETPHMAVSGRMCGELQAGVEQGLPFSSTRPGRRKDSLTSV